MGGKKQRAECGGQDELQSTRSRGTRQMEKSPFSFYCKERGFIIKEGDHENLRWTKTKVTLPIKQANT